MIDFWIFPLSTIWGAYHNRGVVINLEHAVDFDGTGFRLDNGSNVPVSRKLLKNARQTFMKFLFQRRS